MASDDDETSGEGRAAARLPPSVERALAAARTDHERKGGRWLAVIPVGLALIFLALMMPRAAAPEVIPMPRVDGRVLERVARDDDALAAAAESERLPTAVLAVGGAVRAFNVADARDDGDIERIDARRRLDGALRDLRGGDGVVPALLSLRALQTRRFLDAVARWEATGEADADFAELAGGFVDRARDAGWVTGRRVLLDEHQRRVAFKTVWNALIGADASGPFALSLDEQRALYVLYLQHPHPPDSNRAAIDVQRRDATSPEACAAVAAEERRQSELWRAEKIRKLGSLDPDYPAAYALGVSYYRAGRYDLSAEAFTAFLDASPDGAYALRAKNHLKAALVAAGSL